MAKVADHLKLYPGSSKNALRELGNSSYVDKAIAELVSGRFVKIEPHGQSHRHFLVRAYPEGSDIGDGNADEDEDF